MFQVNVPCNGCTACCQNDLIMLHPEMGDDASKYQTVPAMNPITGKAGIAIAKKPNGECVYLGENGCTIHGKSPAICREFDCRRFLKGIGNRADQRRLMKSGMISKNVFDAAKARIHTLPNEAV